MDDGWGADLRQAASSRTLLLVLGVLVIQLAFVFSYVGAFHSPKPHRIAVALVAPAQEAQQLVARLDALPGTPLKVNAVADEAAARAQLRDGETSAVLVVDPNGRRDRLLIAAGAGASLATAVEAVARQAERAQGRSISVEDAVPLQSGDARGLTGFYLVVGWLVGGYLCAALLGIANGPRPANARRATIRLGGLLLYAILSGLLGALIVDPLLGAQTGHLLALWWLGALVVFAAGTVTVALESLAGIVGIGLAVLLFVVLGNPSAGGAFQSELLPGFWRTIGGVLPAGAGTDTVRRIVYFGGHGIAGHVLVLALWAAIGAAVTLAVGARNAARPVAISS
ncbi:hypothetical protein [Conexibacter sp. CPCC 206217]|uniref:hypothetical protein n=1 Tax=Conexibacter sp. CPCC 206217 TaxID=3064574 RepID=UPI00271E2BC4|nr:hypothetical protein [Conexibacter sp. CPCC 206217]MDO8209095.1 hypothetical protein [Conexibacter sp. CPCC 206217]